MEIDTADSQSVNLSDVLGLATWNRQRTSEELQNFVATHHAALADSDEIA